MAEELNNPIFEDEREFLERKKQEYERALRGDVEHIKEQGTHVGKVALVGAGLAGSVWLITKVLGGGKSKRKRDKNKHKQKESSYTRASSDAQPDYDGRHGFDADDDFDLDDEAFSTDRSAEYRDDEYKTDEDDHYAQSQGFPGRGAHLARESAQAFMAYDDQDQQPDLYDHDDNLDDFDRQQGVGNEQEYDNGFGGDADQDDLPQGRLDFGPAVHQHRQGSQPSPMLAYDDSRRLPHSEAFPAQESSSKDYQTQQHDVDVAWPTAKRESSLGQGVGSMVMSFLGTSMGKAVAAQATAAVLAYVTSKMNDKQPARATAENADLANAPATTPFYGSTPAPASSSPAVSLTLTDAPTEHPTS